MHLEGGHFAMEEHAASIAAHIARVFGSPTGTEAVEALYRGLGAGRLDAALALLAKDARGNDNRDSGRALDVPFAPFAHVLSTSRGDLSGVETFTDTAEIRVAMTISHPIKRAGEARRS